MSNTLDDFSHDEAVHMGMAMAEWIVNGHDCHDAKGHGIHLETVRGIAKSFLRRYGQEAFGPAITEAEVPFENSNGG